MSIIINLFYRKLFPSNHFIVISVNILTYNLLLQPLYQLRFIVLHLVSLNFNDFYLLLNPLLLVSFLWFFFFKLNTIIIKSTQNNILYLDTLKINSNSTFVSFYLYTVTLMYFGVYTFHGRNDLVWFNHFNINNFTINLLYLFLTTGFGMFFILTAVTKKTNLVKSIDYLFSINNLVILLPYLFFVNTVFTFLFLLELVSAILLYKLVSSKIWFKKSIISKIINNNVPQNYINMVFFQYWVTFFSTVFIVYFYVNVFYLYGTSEWFVIQFFNTLEIESTYSSTSALRILILIFLISIFFKLGVTPFHLFKIEVYKGIPFLSIFFYSTYYFIIFFLFFLFLLSDYLALFSNQYFIFVSLLLLLGSIYVVTLLFDVSFLKTFFTYSTVINTIGFLIAFIANL